MGQLMGIDDTARFLGPFFGSKSVEELSVQLQVMCNTLKQTSPGVSIEYDGVTVTRTENSYKVFIEAAEFEA